MNENQEILTEIAPIKGGKVTFRDGKQDKIEGVGLIEILNQP